jgi:hypothetical protein
VRGHGVANAVSFAPGATELVAAMQAEAWVAEDPEAHLLPHLEAACRNLPLELRGVRTLADGTFEVEVAWSEAPSGVGAVRQAVFALAGSVAETASYVRQRREDGRLTFDLVTGMIDDDAAFDPHGHTIRFSVTETSV